MVRRSRSCSAPIPPRRSALCKKPDISPNPIPLYCKNADFLWRTIQGIDRITGLRDQDINPPPTMLAPLLRATGAANQADLRATMAQAEDDVHDCFTRNIGE